MIILYKVSNKGFLIRCQVATSRSEVIITMRKFLWIILIMFAKYHTDVEMQGDLFRSANSHSNVSYVTTPHPSCFSNS